MDQTLPATPTAPLEAGMLPGSVPGVTPGQELSVINLFLQADTIVKIVMVLLLLASFWTWAIIFDKALRLRRLRNQAKQFEEAFWSGGSLEVLFDRLESKVLDPMSALFVAAMREWRRSAAKGLVQTEHMRMSLQERIERVMDITLGREMDHLERHMIFLASVGSAAPFVGLFGTVWGRLTGMPTVSSGAVTMKMTSSTSITSTIGVTLISAIGRKLARRPLRPFRPLRFVVVERNPAI